MCAHELRGLLYFILFNISFMQYDASHKDGYFVAGMFFGLISFIEMIMFLIEEIKK